MTTPDVVLTQPDQASQASFELTAAQADLDTMQRAYDFMAAQDKPPTSQGWEWAGKVLTAAHVLDSEGELTDSSVGELIAEVCIEQPGSMINSRKLDFYMIRLRMYGDALLAPDKEA